MLIKGTVDLSNVADHIVGHLFRHESGKMVSVITRILGADNIDTAEDIVQEVLLSALAKWRMGNVPQNPAAYLYKSAKNRAIDFLRRKKYFSGIKNDIELKYQTEWTLSNSVDEMFAEGEIKDSQLRMVFTCCHPALPPESQIALTLKTLCGFSVREIASALITTDENISKRLFRAKKKIREEQINLEVPAGDELAKRLGIVNTVIYLLFNEGYNSTSDDKLIRRDLCEESIRLGKIIAEGSKSDNPDTRALLALMYFHFSRFDARTGNDGEIITLENQDRKLWDKEKIYTGYDYLFSAASGGAVGQYHIEAAISAQHCIADNFGDTNWREILRLYDALLQIKDNPVIRLNRSVVNSRLTGADNAIAEILGIDGLDSYHFYHSALGDLFRKSGQPDKARLHFEKAIKLSNSEKERQFLSGKLKEL
jgi:RNA polymerase sigma factor (sigma-70 family)